MFFFLSRLEEHNTDTTFVVQSILWRKEVQYQIFFCCFFLLFHFAANYAQLYPPVFTSPKDVHAESLRVEGVWRGGGHIWLLHSHVFNCNLLCLSPCKNLVAHGRHNRHHNYDLACDKKKWVWRKLPDWKCDREWSRTSRTNHWTHHNNPKRGLFQPISTPNCSIFFFFFCSATNLLFCSSQRRGDCPRLTHSQTKTNFWLIVASRLSTHWNPHTGKSMRHRARKKNPLQTPLPNPPSDTIKHTAASKM